MYTAADVITAGLLCVLVALLAVIAFRAWMRSRISAAEIERRRRSMLLASGQLGDANLLEIHDHILVYSYVVRGVVYTASQDISGLERSAPGGLASLAAICVRYDPRNPANSIVLAEGWSGLGL